MAGVTIRIRDNGPLVVEGPATIVDATGRTYQIPTEKPAIALCRCGASSKKPFCDGSHKGCNFMSVERVPEPS